ncbi:hypothetical protein [Streptomyces sp. NPDC056491]|uniref:hypothetical protein n=1 Tax=Streptomyces sp. NPDC056491 TaxID=3345837 RepID=UPI00369EECC1
MITPVYGGSEVRRSVIPGGRPGAVVEVGWAAAPYAFTCEERHMKPTPRTTGAIRNADAV